VAQFGAESYFFKGLLELFVIEFLGEGRYVFG